MQSPTVLTELNLTWGKGMNSYTVILKDGTDDGLKDELKKLIVKRGGKIEQEYRVILGFSALIPESLVSILRAADFVESVES
ncbi:hypothetical protein PHLH6_39150 [Pseudomonas sp. Seg1]|uniref:hypothetical protein n=1 Tax=Pseudomonas sp. Seg1 TaxID=2678259 RepID=UPI001BB30B2D|nr:hypothetical protein [Pseudomonas sp. Seg1]BBP71911.1 hypothetical protein PHLH6_39150 [Pseudomonas sp. Seg1]